MLGDLMKAFADKNPEKADKYVRALNEMYFYTNSAWMTNRNIELNYNDLRERYIEISKKYKEFL
jgi:ABC-type nitrate/sulfonate/bicarbonate transport system substrate-binding protein